MTPIVNKLRSPTIVIKLIDGKFVETFVKC